jgi:putative oxidoreductase
MNLALLILRIACGVAFVFHGSQILFGAFGGPGPERFAASMHMSATVGYLVGLAQFAGGLAVLTGILFRVGTVCIMVVMLGAIFKVHLPHGYDINKEGFEYALTQLLIAVALYLTGAGAYSLGSRLPRRWRKW